MKFMGRVWIRAALLATFALPMSLISYADEVQIPFGIYLEEFKAECKSHGLDLDGNRNSDGFVQDKASNFCVFTYHRTTLEQMEIIKKATWKTIRK